MSSVEKLTYINSRGESIVFSHKSVYFAESFTGLSGVRHIIHTVNSMDQDGETSVSQRADSRDVGVSGGINETDPDKAREYRRKLMRVLVPKDSGTLVYEYGDIKRVIGCMVEEADVYKKRDIYFDFSVEFFCPYPYWGNENDTRTDIAAWIGAFEFPLEIPHDTGMEFSYREPSLIVPVYNSGDVQTGMRVVFRAVGSVTNPMVLDVKTQEYMQLTTEMEKGDKITIKTGFNQKGVTLQRDGVTTNIYRKRAAGWTWLQLSPGDTLIKYDADENIDNLEVSIYHNNYSGV